MAKKFAGRVLQDVLNEGLDDILVTIKSITNKSKPTLRVELDNYKGILLGDILPLYENYMQRLSAPGSLLTSKDNITLHNLRKLLEGMFLLFEARILQFGEKFHDLFSDVFKSTRKRPSKKVKEEEKDPLTAISRIAEGAMLAAAEGLIPEVPDFDFATVFQKAAKGRDTSKVTIQQIPTRLLPTDVIEIQFDDCEEKDLDFDNILAGVADAMISRTRLPFTEGRLQVPTDLIGDESLLEVPADHIRDRGLLDVPADLILDERAPPILETEKIPFLVLAEAMVVAPPPTETTPTGEIPRIVVDEGTVSQEQESFGATLRRRLEESEAQEERLEQPRRPRRKKGSLPDGFLKSDRLRRVNLLLKSETVNKMTENPKKNLHSKDWWRKVLTKEDPFSEEKNMEEVMCCPFEYNFYKKYKNEMEEDYNDVEFVVQYLKEEFPPTSHVPLMRATMSGTASEIERRTPLRPPQPSPSPTPPVVDSLIPDCQLVEVSGDHTPLLQVPAPLPASHSPIAIPSGREARRNGHPEQVVDSLIPEHQIVEVSGDHTPLISAPLPTSHSPVTIPSGRKTRRNGHPKQVLEEPDVVPEVDILDNMATQIPELRSEGVADARMRVDVDSRNVETVPDDFELSEAAQNSSTQREQLRLKVTAKLRETFFKDPASVLRFTDLCPQTSTKQEATTLWGEKEVSLIQDSPHPDHIFIRAGKNKNSSTETSSD